MHKLIFCLCIFLCCFMQKKSPRYIWTASGVRPHGYSAQGVVTFTICDVRQDNAVV
nr:MAG TPA: hypothetical protein [Caudoviricetes sp.]